MSLINPYQHYTNAIEQYFSVFKSKLRKKKGIGYEELRGNITLYWQCFSLIFKLKDHPDGPLVIWTQTIVKENIACHQSLKK